MDFLRFVFLAAFLGAFPIVHADPAGPIPIGGDRELFLDGFLISQIGGGAELRLHHPVPREIAIVHDAPWEGNACGYHNIFQDGSLYRMYYHGCQQYTYGTDRMIPGDGFIPLCYAESNDGIHWRKPDLGLVEFKGSKANNILLTNGLVDGVNVKVSEASVFKDENPDAAPDARYKAFFRSGGEKGVFAFKSADGIHWRAMSRRPVITDGWFDSQNLAFWDPVHREYRAYWRYFTLGDPGKTGSWRAIRTGTSHDFIHWEHHEDLRYVDSPLKQLYTSQVKPYFRAPQILIGFPTRYVELQRDDGSVVLANAGAGPEEIARWGPSLRALPEYKHRVLRASLSEREGSAVTEALIMASRDGVLFKRWNEAFLRPGIERPGTWVYGQQYIGWQMVETKSALNGAPDEISLYAEERANTSDLGDELRRYTLRLDGFVSIEAPLSGGEAVTKPVTFAGRRLTLNFSTSAAGGIRVAIEDADGHPYRGFSLQDCRPVYGDTLDRPVVWKKGEDVSSLAGKPIRLRFSLRDADLYAFKFGP